MLPSTFKPNEGSQTSDYTSLESGDNRLRILSDFITGNSYWTGDIRKNEERKPVRKHDNEPIDMSELGWGKYGPDEVKQFIACVVWNYQTNKIELFETDKFSIIGDLWGLEKDVDWGDSKNYDIVIRKTGQNKETRYKVDPKPGKPVTPEILESFKNKPVNLKALFHNGNPFETGKEEIEDPEGLTDRQTQDVTDDIPF